MFLMALSPIFFLQKVPTTFQTTANIPRNAKTYKQAKNILHVLQDGKSQLCRSVFYTLHVYTYTGIHCFSGLQSRQSGVGCGGLVVHRRLGAFGDAQLTLGFRPDLQTSKSMGHGRPLVHIKIHKCCRNNPISC